MMMRHLKTLLRLKKRRGRKAGQTTSLRPTHDSESPSRIHWARTGLVLFTIAALSALMSIHLTPDRITLREGDRSPREVRAPRSVIYIDNAQTERLQQAASAGTRPVYDQDHNVAAVARRTVVETFDRLLTARASLPPKPKPGAIAEQTNALLAEFGSAFTRAQLRRLLTAPVSTFESLRQVTLHQVEEAMDRDIRDFADLGRPADDLRHVRETIAAAALDALPNAEDATIVRAVADLSLRPNRILDQAATDTRRREAERNVVPVQEPIATGDRILGAGEIVTREHLDKFTALGLLNPRLDLTTGAAVCILAATMVLLAAFYIARTLPRLYNDTRRLALLSIIVLLSVFGLKIGATMLGLSFSNGQLGYLGMMSVAAAGMLVSVLIDRHLAVLIVALLAVQSGLIMNHEIRFTVMTLMSSLMGIATVGCVRSRTNLLTTTAAMAATNVGMVVLLGMLLGNTVQELTMGSLWAVCSALFATFLYWFGVLMLERPFGILTRTTLMELGSTDRPLLKQLCAVAPGTYAHSMMVGSLAETGAQAVGADALLCRVGGYYHDIGKMKRPDFFVENQRRENVHGRLSPSLSALIITAHVRDGMDMAKEHKLPGEIRDIIQQHHGTTLIRYFYHQALEDCESSDETPPGLEERFRYPGPKPQTRESAIVLLADSVEAATRTLDKPSRERLETMINAIVRDKIEDGQLDACDLTFRDVRAISEAFLHFLTAMMHGRIDYPQSEPRTASGLPMEVVRSDLRPEALPRPQHEEARRLTDAGAALENDTEVAREIAAHREAKALPNSSDIFSYLVQETEPETLAREVLGIQEGEVPASVLTLSNSEANYGSHLTERTEIAGSDDALATGREASAARGRAAARRSKRSADR